MDTQTFKRRKVAEMQVKPKAPRAASPYTGPPRLDSYTPTSGRVGGQQPVFFNGISARLAGSATDMSSAVLRLNKAFAYWGDSKPLIKMESLGHGAAVVWVSHPDLDPGQISAVTTELGKITGGKK